jgi:hypothetical protein
MGMLMFSECGHGHEHGHGHGNGHGHGKDMETYMDTGQLKTISVPGVPIGLQLKGNRSKILSLRGETEGFLPLVPLQSGIVISGAKLKRKITERENSTRVTFYAFATELT